MKINTTLSEALETKDIKTVITAFYDIAYETTTSENIFDVIIEGFNCGCGSYSDEDEALFKKVFYYCKEHKNNSGPGAEFKEHFGDEDRMAEMMMSILDSFGLVEHGSTIRYPWLSDTGQVLYDALKELDRIEEKFTKENEWYKVECGFTLIDNPYEERKEETEGGPWIPEVLKSMIDDSGDNVLSVKESNNNIFVIGDVPEDLLKSYSDSNNVGSSYFETPYMVSVKIDKEETDGLNREQRRKHCGIFRG